MRNITTKEKVTKIENGFIRRHGKDIGATNQSSDSVLKAQGLHAVVQIEDDSLRAVGIENGTCLLMRPGYSDRIGDSEPLTIWQRQDVELSADVRPPVLVGYAYDNFGDTCIAKPNGTTAVLNKRRGPYRNRCKWVLLGVIAGSIAYTEFPSSAKADEELGMGINEIEATCSVCSATRKGSKPFLSSVRWLIREKRTKCPECW